MRRALAAFLLLGLAGAARAEGSRRDLSDPDAFKRYVEGSRERQALPEELPPAAPAAARPQPLPAYARPAVQKALDSSRVPRWTPELGAPARAQGLSAGRAVALAGLGGVAILAGLSLRRSAPLEDEPRTLASGGGSSSRPAPEEASRSGVDLEPLPPDAKV